MTSPGPAPSPHRRLRPRTFLLRPAGVRGPAAPHAPAGPGPHPRRQPVRGFLPIVVVRATSLTQFLKNTYNICISK
jgi:hypothetical protein